MNILRRRYPSYMTDFPETEHRFATKEEFLNIDWIQDIASKPNFHQFSICMRSSEDHPVSRLIGIIAGLMAEFKDGETYFIVGWWLQLDDEMGLPDWDLKVKQVS